MAGDSAGARKLSAMFDAEVIEAMRRQFDSADKDGNGQLDAKEACELFAKHCCPEGASDEEVRKTAENLVHQMDADKSGTISFEEYCFRFGRRYQMEAARRRRTGDADKAPEKNSTESTSAGAAPQAASGQRDAGAGASPGANFAPGARVILRELRSAPQLNGRFAKVLRYDTAAARFVVELEGDGGQKSLRPENLRQAPGAAGSGASRAAGGEAFPEAKATARRWFEKGKAALQQVIARVQLALAEYEWWQIILGAALVLLFIMAYFQVNSRYRTGGRRKTTTPMEGRSARSRYSEDSEWEKPGREQPGREQPSDEGRRQQQREDWDREPPRRNSRYDDYDDEEYYERRPRGRRPRYDQYDDDDGYGGGGGGLLSGGGSLYTLLILGGLGYACWTGIIPVHRMSWFQIYMLWQFLEPLLLGGRRGGLGGGFGRGFGRRRGFF